MTIFLKELILLFRYFFVTFSLLSLWCFKKFPTILLFFFYPIGKIFKKKLVILHALDLVNSSFFLTFYITTFFIFLYFPLFLKIFFSSSWYTFQVKLFTSFFYITFFYITLSFFLSFFLSFLLFNFSVLWNFETLNSFHLFEIQFQVLRFLEFQITNLNLFCFLSFLFLIVIITTRWFFQWKKIYFIFREIKIILFCFLSFLFSFSYTELTIQFFLVLNLIFFFLEFIFFYICWRLN
uniref:Sec-independent protein translocase component TatC n=1 Tax=Amplisiphonia pacifica TaxID=1563190 RepID=UPI0022FD81C0|nr:Sec-independent protein translocase component TatC [Amplisiphonia pacifica]WAX04314.1 Sec-independent protein translocase component TatC [Amplisiphonia pacifica]